MSRKIFAASHERLKASFAPRVILQLRALAISSDETLISMRTDI
ncbi:MAG: hypothetical protein QME28_07685 [Candidatus Saccharicenans sp.]|nr:hypothetical protein [Candidatus Saccharicenans sp.]